MNEEWLDVLQARVWENLRTGGLLGKILSESRHADESSNYVGIRFWREFQAGRDCKYHMWVQILIQHRGGFQPVTPKLYRITEKENEQRQLCGQIWNKINVEDIVRIAALSADEYYSGRRWMDTRQRIAMEEFHPAVQRGIVSVELVPSLAQYKVSRS